jgi:hypothetical protein
MKEIIIAIICLCIGFFLGTSKTKFDIDMQEANISSRCYSKKNLEAYVAKDGENFACFKQNIDNKKISKSLIVMDDTK